ncbi:unnamed protein product [Adineta steineri]|uniref:Uncharacterized protein n=1 Tax=Adineta steineri TaxID=433720 RepID=A0A815MDD1_9BILA|nr:unnamed protein product [Adineta steineri]
MRFFLPFVRSNVTVSVQIIHFKTRWIEKQTPTGITDTVNNQLYTLKTIKKEKLWNRLNNDNLTPLTLAADLSRGKMLSWLLSERKIVQWSYGDVSCILHPLDQLDLDFQKNDKQNPLCVLEVIIKNNDTELIHPILTSLIDQKWKHFVYRSFSQRFIFTFMYLLTFLVTTILEQSRTETSEDPSDEINTKNFNRSRYMLCSIGHTIVIAGAVLKGGREIKEMSTMGMNNYLKTTASGLCFLLMNSSAFNQFLGIYIS